MIVKLTDKCESTGKSWRERFRDGDDQDTCRNK